MSEFTDVMEQAKRMCKAFSDGHCSECPIGNANVLECGITVTSEMDCKEVERRVMQWAEKHPEPGYPTWREWQNSTFPDAGSHQCIAEPIPADIAEKLGIKPKEG